MECVNTFDRYACYLGRTRLSLLAVTVQERSFYTVFLEFPPAGSVSPLLGSVVSACCPDSLKFLGRREGGFSYTEEQGEFFFFVS